MTIMLRVKAQFNKEKIMLPDHVLSKVYDAVLSEHPNEARIEVICLDLWKTSDLRRWNLPPQQSPLARLMKTSIPPNKAFVISESVVLQIDFVRDISRPAYQQLQKVISRFSENVLVSEDGEAQSATNNKSKAENNGKRMLMMELTDGVTTVRGMEYAPISQLSTSTPPGVKVRLTPPITCRRGMMLLKDTNVQIIGGCVQELGSKYAQKNVLASVLKGKDGFLAEMEKSAPPCPPPAARTAAPNNSNALVPNVAPHGGNNDFHFDAEGDALLAAVPMDEFLPMDSMDTDQFLSQALDAYESENLNRSSGSSDSVIIL